MNRQFRIKVDGQEHKIDIRDDNLLIDNVPFVWGTDGDAVTLDGISYDVQPGEGTMTVDGLEYAVETQGFRIQRDKPKRRNGHGGGAAPAGEGNLTALMPGKIVKVLVTGGDEVKAGDVMLILEAMKMENEIEADRNGKIKVIHVAVGDNVEGGQALIDFE